MYKFVCDLQSLLGYSPEELQAMVAQQQQQQSASTPTLEQSMQDSTSATPPMSQLANTGLHPYDMCPAWET